MESVGNGHHQFNAREGFQHNGDHINIEQEVPATSDRGDASNILPLENDVWSQQQMKSGIGQTHVTDKEETSPQSPLSPIPRPSNGIKEVMVLMTPLILPDSSLQLPRTPILRGESPLQSPIKSDNVALVSAIIPTTSALVTSEAEQISAVHLPLTLSPSMPLLAKNDNRSNIKTERGRTFSVPMSSHSKVGFKSRGASHQQKPAVRRISSSLMPVTGRAPQLPPVENGISAPLSPASSFNIPLGGSITLSSDKNEFMPSWQIVNNSESSKDSSSSSSMENSPNLQGNNIKPKHQRSSSITLTWNGLHPEEKPSSSSSSLTDEKLESNPNSNSNSITPLSSPSRTVSSTTSPANGLLTATSPINWQPIPSVNESNVVKPPGLESFVWEYVQSELASNDFDALTLVDLKRERVQNFLSVPQELEKVY